MEEDAILRKHASEDVGGNTLSYERFPEITDRDDANTLKPNGASVASVTAEGLKRSEPKTAQRVADVTAGHLVVGTQP